MQPKSRPLLVRLAYTLLKRMFRFAARVYFRALEQVDPPPAGTAGRLFAANHWNGIVDPLVILATARYVASPVAKSTLFSIPIFKQVLAIADAVPVMRRRDAPEKTGAANDAVFDRVAEHLGSGGNVLIFPEGTSHSEPHVLPLKSGASRMLARAYGEGARGLSLQAVALDFDAPDTFRSRALVTYGPVHAIDAIVAEVGDGEPLVRILTERIAADLSTLVIQSQSKGELQLIRASAEILSHEPEIEDDALSTRSELARTIIARARELGPDDPRYREVADAVHGYERARRATGLTEEQVARGHDGFSFVRLLHGLFVIALVPFALLGALLYFVPYEVPSLATKLSKGETDVVSTYKLGLGLVVFPLWTALLLVGAWLLGRDLVERAFLAGLVIVTPWAALAWLDRLDDHRGLRLLKTASAAGVRQLARLRLLRSRALAALLAARSP